MLDPILPAMNEGRFEDAAELMVRGFQWFCEHLDSFASLIDPREMAAIEAEKCGDWPTMERLYYELIADENAKPIKVPYRHHFALGKLYDFQGLPDKAFEQGRLGHEVGRDNDEMIRVMFAVSFARLASVHEHSPEVENALRESLASLEAGPLYANLRARALAEIAYQRVLAGDFDDATELVDTAFAELEPQQALNEMPGHQSTFARAWRVRAAIHTNLENRPAAIEAWQQAIDWFNRSKCWFSDETPIDADEHSRFLDAAVDGLMAVGEIGLANEVRERRNAVRAQWTLVPLDP